MKKNYLKILSAGILLALLILMGNILFTPKEEIKAETLKLQYISEQGYRLWYPVGLEAETIYDFEGFSTKEGPKVQILIVPQAEGMEYNDTYLTEAASNYRISGEYEQVTVSDVKNLTSESDNVRIHMLEVVHDGDMERFYIVSDGSQTLLITVSLEAEAVEEWKADITKMIQSISFE